MRIVTVMYYEEPDGWWAESPDYPSFFAAGDSFEETKEHVRASIYRVAGERYVGVRHLAVRPTVRPAASGAGTMEHGLTDAQHPGSRLVLTS